MVLLQLLKHTIKNLLRLHKRKECVDSGKCLHRGHTEMPCIVWCGRSYSWKCQEQSLAGAIHSGCKWTDFSIQALPFGRAWGYRVWQKTFWDCLEVPPGEILGHLINYFGEGGRSPVKHFVSSWFMISNQLLVSFVWGLAGESLDHPGNWWLSELYMYTDNSYKYSRNLRFILILLLQLKCRASCIVTDNKKAVAHLGSTAWG